MSAVWERAAVHTLMFTVLFAEHEEIVMIAVSVFSYLKSNLNVWSFFSSNAHFVICHFLFLLFLSYIAHLL